MKKITNKLGHLRNMPPLIAAVCMLALFAASCKKGDQGKQHTNYLTSGPWKNPVTEWRTTGGSWTSPSWTSVTYPPSITFLENGTYITGTSSGSAGTWQLSGDGQQLILVNAKGTSLTATIASLSGGTLQLSTPLDPKYTYSVEGSGSNSKYTYYDTERTTFSH